MKSADSVRINGTRRSHSVFNGNHGTVATRLSRGGRLRPLDFDPEDYDGANDVIGNVGSYVAEYIGSYGEDLFDRSIEELAADPDRSVSEALPEQDGWELDGIGIVDRDGETRHEGENTGVEYIQIDGAEHLDPPKVLPPDRPKPRSTDSTLEEYG